VQAVCKILVVKLYARIEELTGLIAVTGKGRIAFTGLISELIVTR